MKFEDEVLEKIQIALESGEAASTVELDYETNRLIKPLGLLTSKPVIYVTNVCEEDLAKGNKYCEEVVDMAKSEGSEVVRISAQVESELIESSVV